MISVDLIDLLESHISMLVDYCLCDSPSIISKVGESIKISPIHIVQGTWYQASVRSISIGYEQTNMTEFISSI